MKFLKNICSKYVLLFFILMIFNSISLGQDVSESDRKKSFDQIQLLRDSGALVLRLTLRKKKEDLYRKAGKTALADEIHKKNKEKNLLLALAFLDKSFNFCPVYIIDAKDYGRVLNGETSGFFLNRFLKVDSTINMKENDFLFVEVGTVYETVRKLNSFKESEVSSTPIIQNALVIKDKGLNQLIKPFPFNVPLDGVFLDIANFIVYQKGRKEGDLLFNDMESYRNYMEKKYKIKKKDLFTVEKIFNLNLRFFGFHSYAIKAKEKAKEKAKKKASN